MNPAFLARIALVAAAASCATASAQTLYKLIDKNGKITYSESRPKEFDGQVIELNIDPNANRAVLPKYEPAKTAPDAMTPEAVANVNQAQQKLAAAKKALDEAKANPEMQRVGKVGGGAREVVSPEYEARVAKLEQDDAAGVLACLRICGGGAAANALQVD